MRRLLCCYTRNRKVLLNEMAGIAPIDSSIALWKSYAEVDFDPEEGLAAISRKDDFFKALAKKVGSGKLLLKAHSANVLVNKKNIYTADHVDKVIHIVRHPMDVLPSYAHHMGMDVDVAWKSMQNEKLVLNPKEKQLKEYLSSWQNHTHSWLNFGKKNPTQYLFIRYEDLQTKPITTFKKVIEFCEFPYSESKLAKAIAWSDFSEMKLEEDTLAEGFKEAPKGRKFFRSGKVGGSSQLPIKLVQDMESKLSSTMSKLKYGVQ